MTGGNGFIGSAVVRLLVEAGHSVTCLLRPTSHTRRIDDLTIRRLIGDIRDPEIVRAATQDCDVTIHLASISSWSDIHSSALEEIVEGGTRNVLEAAARVPGHRLVFVSSVAAINGSDKPQIFTEKSAFSLSDPRLAYAHAKRRAEDLCLKAARTGQFVVIVNPGEVYGPHDDDMITAGNLVDFSRSNPVFVCSGGTGLAHVEDIASGIIAAATKGRSGERYILSGENITIRQLADLSLQLLRRKAKVVTLPNSLIRVLAAGAKQVGLKLPFNPDVIPYATRYWFVDASKARDELGVSFRSAYDTLHPTIAWLKGRGDVA